MSIKEVIYYRVVCDGCGADAHADGEYSAWVDESAAREDAQNTVGDWLVDVGAEELDFCRDCSKGRVDDEAADCLHAEIVTAGVKHWKCSGCGLALGVAPTVRWFCRDADGRETFLDGDEEYARAHQAGFANLTPESRCVLIRRTLTPGGSVLGEEEIDA